MKLRGKILPLFVAIAMAIPAQAAEDRTIDLYAGQVRVIPTKPVKRVAIGDGKVLSTTVVDGNELLLLGDAEGETSLRVWFKDGSEAAYRVLVAPKNVGRAAEEMRELMGAEKSPAKIRVVGDHVVVDGKNLAPTTLARVRALQALYPKTIGHLDKPQKSDHTA